MVNRSCDYPHPEVKGVVRAELFGGAFILEKIDETHTRVTYISDADPKGSIPQMVKNFVSGSQGQVAGLVEPAMKKDGY